MRSTFLYGGRASEEMSLGSCTGPVTVTKGLESESEKPQTTTLCGIKY
jgi:hypothetical protein